jgi:general secretion pathway protein F
MGLYLYRALTQDGREVSGSLEYPEESAVLAYLESQGYIPVEIASGREGAGGAAASGGIAARELKKFSVIEFTRGLGMLLRAGLPIDKALVSLAAASADSGTRKLLQQVGRDIREGSSLSKALRGFDNLFGRLYLSLIQAGEISGNLEVSIDHLSAYLDSQQQLRERIVNAMIYPLVLLVVTVFSIVLLMVVVMPKFKQLFEDMDAELPAVTQAFLSTSDFLRDYGSAICALLLGLVAAVFMLRGNPGFRALLDQLVLRLPWIGELVKKVQVSRYAETLSMMLQCGIPIQRSLGASCQVVSNSWIRQAIVRPGGEGNQGRRQLRRRGRASFPRPHLANDQGRRTGGRARTNSGDRRQDHPPRRRPHHSAGHRRFRTGDHRLPRRRRRRRDRLDTGRGAGHERTRRRLATGS